MMKKLLFNIANKFLHTYGYQIKKIPGHNPLFKNNFGYWIISSPPLLSKILKIEYYKARWIAGTFDSFSKDSMINNKPFDWGLFNEHLASYLHRKKIVALSKLITENCKSETSNLVAPINFSKPA